MDSSKFVAVSFDQGPNKQRLNSLNSNQQAKIQTPLSLNTQNDVDSNDYNFNEAYQRPRRISASGGSGKSLLSNKCKSYLSVVGASLIYFAMGLYFAAGSTGVYLSSYLIYKSNSDMQLNDAIWFLSAAGFSALFLPVGGLLEAKIGVRSVCLFGGCLQSAGILATYWALDTNFLAVVVVYGGSFLLSLAICYTSPLVNVCKWHPHNQGLVSGIGAASMAVAPTLFTPLITALVNPRNLPPNSAGLFDDDDILQRVKSSTLIQGSITLSLFLLGSLLTFKAPDDVEQVESVRQSDKKSKAASLEPKFAFKTSEFWLLSFKVLISELIFIYLLFIYKPYGQTFIADDYFLSTIGAACALSNTLGRLSMGHLKDKFGYKAVSLPLSCATTLLVFALPLAKYLNSPLMYASLIVGSVGAVGSQYALMPSACQDSFGPKFASVNIGFVYMSTVIATVSSALLSQYLTLLVGWQGMILLIAVCALLDFVATFFMPAKPAERLALRHKQFYSESFGAGKKLDSVAVQQCPKCKYQYTNEAFKSDEPSTKQVSGA